METKSIIFPVVISLIIIPFFTFAQIAIQGFEASGDTWTFTADPDGSLCTGKDKWGIVNEVGINTGNKILPSEGNQFWGVRDLRGTCNGDANEFEELQFATIDLSSVGKAVLSFEYAAYELDNGDDIKYELTIDGVPQSEVWVFEGSGGLSTTYWDTMRINIEASVSSLALKILIKQNSDTDWMGIDNVRITECTTAENGRNLLGQVENAQVVVNWENPWCYDEMMVVAGTASVSTTPTGDGSAYMANTSFGSGSEIATGEYVVYRGTDSKVTVTNLVNNTDYYFRVFTRIGTNWSSGIERIFKPKSSIPNIVINEVDAQQTGNPDTGEFVELYNNESTSQALDDFVLVLYSGNDDKARVIIDLDGETIGANSTWVLCFGDNTSAYCNKTVSDALQNDAEGIGLYLGRADHFTTNTRATTISLVDGIVYEANASAEDYWLLQGLGQSTQYNEDENNNVNTESLQRFPNGTGSFSAIATTPGVIMLPVELLYFNVVLKNNRPYLSWATAMEENNDYFAIERSKDGENFISIGIAKGAGNTIEKQFYDFVDATAITGTNYYRLKQVDFSGAFEYSPITSVLLTAPATNVRLYPNPTSSMFYMQLPMNWANAHLKIIHITGKVVKQIFITSSLSAISLEGMASGQYVIQLTHGSQVIRRAFVKVD